MNEKALQPIVETIDHDPRISPDRVAREVAHLERHAYHGTPVLRLTIASEATR